MTHDRSRAGATRSPRSESLHPTEKPQRALRLKAWRLVALVAALLVCGALAGTVVIRSRTAVEGWSQRTAAHEPRSIALADLQPRFARAGQGQALGSEDYRRLALHLLEGWSHYRSPDGARAHYPGLPSEAGRAADGLEGISRMLPLAATPRLTAVVRISCAHRARTTASSLRTTIGSSLRTGMNSSCAARCAVASGKAWVCA